jgi:beta-aspartyl-peptidase (threonine type)
MIRRRPIFSLILIIGAVGSPDVFGRTLQRKARDVQAIKAVLDSQVAAWNQRNLERYMEGYWNSPDLTFYSGGIETTGWRATLERYRGRYQGEGKEMGRLTFSDVKIDILGPQSAFVRGRWHLKLSSGDIGGLFTLIFRRFREGWRIVHDHTGAN